MSDAPFEEEINVDGLSQDARADANDQLSLFVNLDGFEGPIDLLLSLSREQKVDLTRISILPLAEQYLEFINNARSLDLEIAADYLVMAAWLAYLNLGFYCPTQSLNRTKKLLIWLMHSNIS